MTSRRTKTRQDQRTGLEAVQRWARDFPSMAEAARSIRVDDDPMDPMHFRLWLREPDRGLRPELARAIALTVGIPFEAVVFKHERMCDLQCGQAKAS